MTGPSAMTCTYPLYDRKFNVDRSRLFVRTHLSASGWLEQFRIVFAITLKQVWNIG